MICHKTCLFYSVYAPSAVIFCNMYAGDSYYCGHTVVRDELSEGISFGSVSVTSIQTCILCLQDIAVVRMLADVMQEQFRIPGLCGLLV